MPCTAATLERLPAVTGDSSDRYTVVVHARIPTAGSLGHLEDPGCANVQDHPAATGLQLLVRGIEMLLQIVEEGSVLGDEPLGGRRTSGAGTGSVLDGAPHTRRS
jgi:hypothetical protein